MNIITWRQKLGRSECPYLERWVLNLKIISIRLHHWNYGDDDRAFHDHPWNFWGIVLKGSYIDDNPEGEEEMPQWKTFYRKAEHKHTVKTNGCWTLLICGPEIREWGFFVLNKSQTNLIWHKAKRYFLKNGHHQCQ